MDLTNFLNSLGSSDMESFSLVCAAYSEFAHREEIFECGFNQSSGYVYIALENGIQICSCFGQSVEYVVTNFNNGNEYFYDSYHDALNHDVDVEESEND